MIMAGSINATPSILGAVRMDAMAYNAHINELYIDKLEAKLEAIRAIAHQTLDVGVSRITPTSMEEEITRILDTASI